MLMIAFAGYALIAASGGVNLLRRMKWMSDRPATEVRLWSVLTASIAAATLGIASMMWVSVIGGGSLMDLMGACLAIVQLSLPVGTQKYAGALVSLALLSCVVRTLVFFGLDITRARQTRRHYSRRLPLVGVAKTYPGSLPREKVFVLEHPHLMAFCLPGRSRVIVLSSATVQRLSTSMLAGVLAHERSHLRRSDHLILSWSQAVARGFSFLPGLRYIADKQKILVEMVADDRAAQLTSPTVVANALAQMTQDGPSHDTTCPAAAAQRSLGAGETQVDLRIRRLQRRCASSWRTPTRRLGLPHLVVAASAAIGALGVAVTVTAGGCVLG